MGRNTWRVTFKFCQIEVEWPCPLPACERGGDWCLLQMWFTQFHSLPPTHPLPTQTRGLTFPAPAQQTTWHGLNICIHRRVCLAWPGQARPSNHILSSSRGFTASAATSTPCLQSSTFSPFHPSPPHPAATRWPLACQTKGSASGGARYGVTFKGWGSSKFRCGKISVHCNFESIRSLFGRDVGAQTNDETEWENKRWVVSSRMLIRGRKLATNIFTADIFIFISFLNSSAKHTSKKRKSWKTGLRKLFLFSAKL